MASRIRSKLLTTFVLLVALFGLSFSGAAFARGGHRSGHHSSGYHSTRSHHGGRKKAVGVPRDSHGRIKRSTRAKDAFRHSHPCPSTGKTTGACPGYVIDHIRPLKEGGVDDPSNMQWQTKAAAKEKDKWE